MCAPAGGAAQRPTSGEYAGGRSSAGDAAAARLAPGGALDRSGEVGPALDWEALFDEPAAGGPEAGTSKTQGGAEELTTVAGDLVMRWTRQSLQPRSSFDRQLLADVRLGKAALAANGGETEVTGLAGWLRERGYDAAAAASRGGTGGPYLALRHSYIVVNAGAGGDGRRLRGFGGEPVLVEASFRECFAIAKPSACYARLLADLPAEFVGSPAQLTALVEVISDQISTSFQEQGMSVPPWRTLRSLLSRWRLPGEEERGGAATKTAAAAPAGPAEQGRLRRPSFRRAAESGRQWAADKVAVPLRQQLPAHSEGAHAVARIAWVRSPTAVAAGERIRSCTSLRSRQ